MMTEGTEKSPFQINYHCVSIRNTMETVKEAEETLIPNGDDVINAIKRDDKCISVACSQRWILAYMILALGVCSYVLRVNMSVAIVSMADSSSFNDSPNRTILMYVNSSDVNDSVNYDVTNPSSGTCKRLAFGETFKNRKRAELTWGKSSQSLVLSALFYGYMVSQIPGGWISGRYGGKHVIGVAMAITSFVTLLMPVCARSHVGLAVTLRVIMGLAMGTAFPAVFAIIGSWALPTERSRFLAMFWFGQMFGTIVGYTSAGYLCVEGFDNGWASVFYVHGALGVAFTVCWYLLVFDSPDTHPRIKDSEKRLLREHLQLDHNQKQLKVPWKRMLTSFPVWSIFITHAADAWLCYLLLTCLPIFMNDVLNFDIQSNGVFSSLPFLSMAVGIAITGVLADFIVSRHWLQVTTVRKIFQIVGNVLAAVFIVVSGFIACDKRMLVIICICLCTFFEAMGAAAGYPCNPVDLAPRYASVIMGISNTLASISGILAPVVVAEMTQNTSPEEWRHVFFLTAGLVCVACVVYGLGASSELAPWAGPGPIEIEVEIRTDIKTLQKLQEVSPQETEGGEMHIQC